MERIASETSFERRESEDERYAICKAPLGGGQQREGRSSRHSHESGATARDIGTRDHFLDRSARLLSGGRRQLSDGQAFGLDEDRQAAGRREPRPIARSAGCVRPRRVTPGKSTIAGHGPDPLPGR